MYSLTFFHTHHALLGNGGNQIPTVGEDASHTQTSATFCCGGPVVNEVPFVEVNGAVPPHGVVEAGHAQTRIRPAESVASQNRFQQAVVTGVRCGRGINNAIGTQRSNSP